MPRDPSGNYTLPAGNPVVTGTTIASTWANTTLSDIGAALTDSLSRTGQGGLLAPFRLVDGTVSAPGLAWQNESTSGLYRAGAFDTRLTIGGADVFKWTSTFITAFQSFAGPPNSAGIVATGGATNGRGGTFTATGAADGVNATGGSGATAGASGIAGSGSGYGLFGQGVSGGLGARVVSSAANIDVLQADGYISLASAANPAATAGFANRVTPKNIAKAWCSVSINAGAITIHDAFNIQASGSWTLGITDITIPFATAMGTTSYSCVGLAATGQPIALLVKTKNTGSVVINVMTFAAPGTPLQPNVNSFGFDFIVYGAQ